MFGLSRLPEPLTWVQPLFAHDGRRAVVLGESGRLWHLEIDPARRAVDVRPLPISVPKRDSGNGWLRSLAGSHALDRLLVWTDRMRVYALPSGELLSEREGPIEGSGAACLTPDGRWLLCVEQERAWVAEVDAPWSTPRETWAFHQTEEPFEPPADSAAPEPDFVFLDHVDTLAVHPLPANEDGEDADAFWLAAGCYGFVVTHLARISGGFAERTEGKSRTFGGLVYDPTELVTPFGVRHLYVLHGFCAGLVALDPATGGRHDCIIRPGGHPYSFFRGLAVSAESPVAVVQCVDGTFLWRPGEMSEPLAGIPGAAWRIYGGEVLCADGEDLLWVPLPARTAS